MTTRRRLIGASSQSALGQHDRSGSRSHEVILRSTNARRLWPRACTSGERRFATAYVGREVADAGAATGAHEHVGRNEYIVTWDRVTREVLRRYTNTTG